MAKLKDQWRQVAFGPRTNIKPKTAGKPAKYPRFFKEKCVLLNIDVVPPWMVNRIMGEWHGELWDNFYRPDQPLGRCFFVHEPWIPDNWSHTLKVILDRRERDRMRS